MVGEVTPLTRCPRGLASGSLRGDEIPKDRTDDCLVVAKRLEVGEVFVSSCRALAPPEVIPSRKHDRHPTERVGNASRPRLSASEQIHAHG
jgi:hypothetical protein